MPELLTTSEVAFLLGVKPNTVYIWWSKGIIPGFRLPTGGPQGPLRFDRAEIDAWIRSGRGGSTMPELRAVR
jgi:excisionase family DNA binding protein